MGAGKFDGMGGSDHGGSEYHGLFSTALVSLLDSGLGQTSVLWSCNYCISCPESPDCSRYQAILGLNEQSSPDTYLSALATLLFFLDRFHTYNLGYPGIYSVAQAILELLCLSSLSLSSAEMTDKSHPTWLFPLLLSPYFFKNFFLCV